jgi:hypothetical protein
MAEPEKASTPDGSLQSLHHMSTTAGMDSGDYVEINGLAVAAVSLAAVSLLGVLHSAFMLLGILATVAGVLALRQISRSNGTQGGRAVAWAGILLAIAVVGGKWTMDYAQAAAEKRHAAEIEALFGRLGGLLAKGDYDGAYQQFSPAFHKFVSQDRFTSTWKSVLTSDASRGDFVQFEPSGLYQFWVTGSSLPTGITRIRLRFAKLAEPLGPVGVGALQGADGVWRVDEMPDLFVDQTKPQR